MKSLCQITKSYDNLTIKKKSQSKENRPANNVAGRGGYKSSINRREVTR